MFFSLRRRSVQPARGPARRGYQPELLCLEQRAVPAVVTVDVGPVNNFMTFSPAVANIHVGDTVHWVWDTSNHSTTSGTCSGTTCTPNGLWDSGVQNAGFTFDRTFNQAGTFSYFCSIHGPDGMTGQIIVAANTTTTAPTISISDVSIREGKSGITLAHFQVHLSHAATAPVTVKFKTANGTAHAGHDYIATAGTLTFKPGQTSNSIVVKIKGDVDKEAIEKFFVDLSSPHGGTLGRHHATGAVRHN